MYESECWAVKKQHAQRMGAVIMFSDIFFWQIWKYVHISQFVDLQSNFPNSICAPTTPLPPPALNPSNSSSPMFLLSQTYNLITVRLDSNNYVLWRYQIEVIPRLTISSGLSTEPIHNRSTFYAHHPVKLHINVTMPSINRLHKIRLS